MHGRMKLIKENTLKTHSLIQGSPEWHAYRAEHFNASDAPAMMGLSPYKSRTELLHERFTGTSKEVDSATQKRFDDGHRFEDLARPFAEEIVGQDLYPVVGSEGKYSASFDGLTMLEDIAFEHKSINDELRSILTRTDVTGADLPEHYQVQMEQQLMVSSAERCLFMASKFGVNDELIECLHCWYEPDGFLRKRIVDGWSQFEQDLADYKPKELADKPQAEAIMQLPALVVQIRGEVANSNLPAFKAAAEQFIANIKTDLQTDQDFADAEATVKFCDKAEKDLELTKSAAIAQTASIDDLMRTIDFIKEQLRSKRLMLEKLVATKKTAIKEKILADAKLAFGEHVASLEAEIKPIRLVYAQPDFAGAAKNKRTLASLHDAVDSELANAKIATNATAADVRAKLAWCQTNAEGYGFLFMDMQQIIGKPMDDLQLLVNTRIADHKRVEAEKAEAIIKRIQAEEEAKAAAKAKAEQEAQKVIDDAAFIELERKRNAVGEEIEAEKQRQIAAGDPGQLAVIAHKSEQRFTAGIANQLAAARTLEQETAAIATAPIMQAMQPDDVVDASMPRPTDEEIIQVVASAFGVKKTEAYAWLLEMRDEIEYL